MNNTLENQVHAYFDLLAADDAAGWVALHRHDAIFVDPVAEEPFVGHDALRAFFDQVGGLSSELTVTDVEMLLAAPTTIAARWTANPTLVVNARTAHWPCVTVFHFDSDGLIRHAMTCWDHQAGLTEAT